MSLAPTLSPTLYNGSTIDLDLQDHIEPLDGKTSGHFGMALGVSSSFVIVGAPHTDTNSLMDSGAAYVFSQDEGSTAWSQRIRLRPNDVSAHALFGYAVAVSGTTALVGAYHNGKGAAYAFARMGDDGPWVQQAKLEASDGAIGDRLGISVDIFGDMAVVGADRHSSTGSDCGAVYVFTRNFFTWTEVSKIEPTGCTSNGYFGHSLGFDPNKGKTLIVGSYGDDTNGALSGSSYIFNLNSTSSEWDLETKLFAFDGAEGDSFGVSTALYRNHAIVG